MPDGDNIRIGRDNIARNPGAETLLRRDPNSTRIEPVFTVRNPVDGGDGIHGVASNDGGNGIHGVASNARGVMGESSFGPGVYGSSDSGDGLIGTTTSGNGVDADSISGVGVRGSSDSHYGGVFQGGRAPLKLQPSRTAGRPTTGQHTKGELFMDSGGALFVCTADGTPGTWRRFTTTPA
jgi:hypothetical protein